MTVGHEQQGVRPALILSADAFTAAGRLVMVAPLTSKCHPAHPHPKVQPALHTGLKLESSILVEQMRSVRVTRLLKRRGVVSPATMGEVEEHVRVLLKYRRWGRSSSFCGVPSTCLLANEA